MNSELVLALDVPTTCAAVKLLDQLPGLRWVKIGALFTREGPPLIWLLRSRGLQVFLDCKWLDIPNTVEAHVTAAREHGVHMVTVHVEGGRTMMELAKEAAGQLLVVGVTVLTSQQCWPEKVLGLAHEAIQAGLDGVVCGPNESGAVRALLGPLKHVVVPGVRRDDDPAADQVRVGSTAPGASHIVVGRAITEATNPLTAARRYGLEA